MGRSCYRPPKIVHVCRRSRRATATRCSSSDTSLRRAEGSSTAVGDLFQSTEGSMRQISPNSVFKLLGGNHRDTGRRHLDCVSCPAARAGTRYRCAAVTLDDGVFLRPGQRVRESHGENVQQQLVWRRIRPFRGRRHQCGGRERARCQGHDAAASRRRMSDVPAHGIGSMCWVCSGASAAPGAITPGIQQGPRGRSPRCKLVDVDDAIRWSRFINTPGKVTVDSNLLPAVQK